MAETAAKFIPSYSKDPAKRGTSRPPSRFKRKKGPVSNAEKAVVAHVVQNTKHKVSENQVRALARALERSPTQIGKLVEQARADFAASAQRYVEIHRTATENALADADHETALKGSQWAMEHIAAEGKRIIDKADASPAMPRVMVGIKIGGLDMKKIAAQESLIVDAETTE